MSWLSKIFGIVSKEERQGITIKFDYCWEVQRVKDTCAFLKTLADIMPDGSVLYIEDGDVDDELQKYLEARKPEKTSKLPIATLMMIPKRFHMKITKENLYGLAGLAEHRAEPEIAMHIHVYKNDTVLLSWYDFNIDPFCISKEIPEDKVRYFCNKLGVKYKECSD